MERARSVWPWLAGVLALALAAALLLPRVSLWDQAVAYMGVTEQVTVTDNSPQPSAPAPGDSAQPGRVAPPTFTPGTPAASANQDLSRAATGYLDLMTVAVLLATLLYALTSLRRQLRLPGTPPGWPQVWPLLALVALPLSLLAVILAAQFQALDITVVEGEHAPVPPSPPAGPLEAAVQQVVGLLAETPLGNLDLYNMLFLLLGTLFLFALLAWVWHLLTARARPTYAWEETREAASAARAAAPAHAPLHRVRLAYAQVEAHLAAAGVHRRAAETPAEYLRRAAAEWPEVAAPLEALGAAYAPVRYGGGVSEGGANLAEQNAEMITAFIRQEPG
ncbi:MAG: DUF4129 domain-containing protein [Deinococcus sp.]|nr:DUF4129 domain-containing protein [Deinococcus sp.]